MIGKKHSEPQMIRPMAQGRALTLSKLLDCGPWYLVLTFCVAALSHSQVALGEANTNYQPAVDDKAEKVSQKEPPTPFNLPKSYRYIGGYSLDTKTQVEQGQAMPVVIAPMVFRVYSDGIVVRVYCDSAGDESFTAYKIYRSDGVGSIQAGGELDIEAGVQAICKTGDMLRQISITRSSMTMVKMPPRSYRVVVTHTIALTSATPGAQSQTKAPPKAGSLASPQRK